MSTGRILAEVKFADAPIGLFVFRGELCVKTEYCTHGRPDAYIVGSGEYFWGGCSRNEEVAKLMVTPVAESDIDKLANYSLYAKARIAKLEAALRDARSELVLDPTTRTCHNVAADIDEALGECVQCQETRNGRFTGMVCGACKTAFCFKHGNRHDCASQEGGPGR